MKPYPSVRLFKNEWLEKLSHVHPITPLVLWVPIISWVLYRAGTVHGYGPAAFGGFALVGLFVWSLTEYALHRFIFHFHPTTTFGRRFQYLMHGVHHEDPLDPSRLVMPPVPGLILAGLLFLGFRGLAYSMGIPGAWVEPFFAFFLVGYLIYDYTHFAVHHFQPRTAIGRTLKAHHMVHHYVDQEARWGVSSPIWDHVFGSMSRARAATSVKAEKPKASSLP